MTYPHNTGPRAIFQWLNGPECLITLSKHLVSTHNVPGPVLGIVGGPSGRQADSPRWARRKQACGPGRSLPVGRWGGEGGPLLGSSVAAHRPEEASLLPHLPAPTPGTF